MARLTETVMQEAAPEKIDESAGILYGTKLLGLTSANGYEYTENCLKTAAPLYDGVKSYVDHNRNSNGDRSLRDWTGVFRNPRFIEGKGIFADHHLRKKSEFFDGIIEAAQRFPTAIGYSHVADGDKVTRGGKSFVDKINDVCSVDHVGDPATTNGIFESKGQPKSLKEFIDAIPDVIPDAQRTKLIEDITAAWPATGGPTANPEYQITLALLSAVQELARSIMDANAKNATAQAEADSAKKKADEEAQKNKDGAANEGKPPTLEAIQRRLDLADAELMLEKSKRGSPNETLRKLQVEALADAQGDARTKLLESFPKVEDKKPLRESRPFDRPDASPPSDGKGAGGSDDPALKAYESRFEESAKRAGQSLAKRRAG